MDKKLYCYFIIRWGSAKTLLRTHWILAPWKILLGRPWRLLLWSRDRGREFATQN